VAQKFNEYSVPPQSITFEITETAAIANVERARTLIESLRAMGARFCWTISAAASRRSITEALPGGRIKVDGLFVKGVAKSYLDYALVESIHRIGTSLGLQTIAEYVETEEIARKLVQIASSWARASTCRRRARGKRSSRRTLLYNSGLPNSNKTAQRPCPLPNRNSRAFAAACPCTPPTATRPRSRTRSPSARVAMASSTEDGVPGGVPGAEAGRPEGQLPRGRAEGLQIGERDFATMRAIAAPLSDQDMQALANYYAEKK
jgi:hypothetical protein